MRVCVWRQLPKPLKGKTGEGVSNGVVVAWDVSCAGGNEGRTCCHVCRQGGRKGRVGLVGVREREGGEEMKAGRVLEAGLPCLGNGSRCWPTRLQTGPPFGRSVKMEFLWR